ncbi:MAG: hypothetical protein E6Q57_20415 [Mycobacterium sp.]|nr:MAG: hypothetical protein E6Q57_20415 [Mycobacterium sp.]
MLAFDHFYGQDLDALEAAGRGDWEVFRIPYQRIYRLARRHFPEAAFVDVRASAAPVYRDNWASYRAAVAEHVRWFVAAYRPEVFVLPSDTIFYFRPYVESFGAAGLSTVVVQKETTISPMTMDIDSQHVAEAVPFMADLMTVCSERHRQFWLRQGVDPDLVVVTGQPRFDVYARPAPPRPVHNLPRLLYFSYDDFAYLPYDGVSTPLGDWTELRRETETVLAEFASASTWQVVAKMHPQQVSLRNWLGPDVVHAATDSDTRDLIRSADVVVGFQTTALFEAALTGTPVIYPAWGPVFERAHELLVPFETYGDLVVHVHGADDLRNRLVDPDATRLAPGDGAKAAAAEHLGPVDGQASDRVLKVLGGYARAASEASPRWRRVSRAVLLGGFAPMLDLAASALKRLGQGRLAASAARRSAHWRQEGSEANTILRTRR